MINPDARDIPTQAERDAVLREAVERLPCACDVAEACDAFDRGEAPFLHQSEPIDARVDGPLADLPF